MYFTICAKMIYLSTQLLCNYLGAGLIREFIMTSNFRFVIKKCFPFSYISEFKCLNSIIASVFGNSIIDSFIMDFVLWQSCLVFCWDQFKLLLVMEVYSFHGYCCILFRVVQKPLIKQRQEIKIPVMLCPAIKSNCILPIALV